MSVLIERIRLEELHLEEIGSLAKRTRVQTCGGIEILEQASHTPEFVGLH